MTILEAVIQGIIQGATEFLPVSSSGHLSVFQHFTGVTGDEAIFTSIALHIGTLIAVFIAFREKIWALILEAFAMLRDIFTGKFSFKTNAGNRRMILMIIVSILPLFVFYIFKDLFTSVSSDSDIIAEGICFLYTAAILTIGDRAARKNAEKGTLKTAGETAVPDALIIGFFQGVALLPGVSRSGSTISAGLMSGMKREDAVEYSFILGIPVILAGALSELLDLGGGDMSFESVPLLIGMAVAAVSGYFAISLIKWLMKSDKFGIFAVYTFILGIAVIGAGIYEHISGSTIIIG
ncbi:MAG: undecaprenyl-diphosphate phosphatase [Oscillospiraceae bacterium]|nr:undecaprenyl-diphosphate phosphatase [Oscillospiraceae bacterium]